MSENEPRKKLPKTGMQEKWKEMHSWLLFARDGMKWELCIKWEDSIKGCKNLQGAFLDDSANYKSSAASEQEILKVLKVKKTENQLAGMRKKPKII